MVVWNRQVYSSIRLIRACDDCFVRKFNVMINDQGLPQLHGFGLSRAVRDSSMGTQATTMATGLIRYSPYEVIFDQKKTVKSDVYAFGCICIHVLLFTRAL